MSLKQTLLCGLSVFFLSTFSLAEASSKAEAEQDDEKRLEEIIVEGTSFSAEPLPNTGRVNFQPIPVELESTPPLFVHHLVELVIRPVVKSEDGTYVADTTSGKSFARVSVTLNPEGKVVGSRIRRPDDGQRAMDLPEAIYAITEVRYLVSTFLGNFQTGFQGNSNNPPIEHRFCLAERTIAFDVKNGETTDLGKLVVRGLERSYRSSDIQHRPIIGADAPFVAISDPRFRDKFPETSGAGVISFNPDGSLCRDSSRRVAGWFSNTELEDALPRFYLASAVSQN